MSFVVKKRDLSDPAQLQALIVEHADDLERGLTVLDARLLGQVTIDVVGVDTESALVLIAVGVVADEAMLLKAVDAYSWCLEYPEAIRRLYPAVRCSSTRPPRVMFVVERMPDAFHRKIKQLGFPEVDCVEFRHLDVDGTAAVYFDTLARLRRDAVPTTPTAAPAAPPAVPPSNGRPTSVKLQKLLGAPDRPTAAREPSPIVRIVPRSNPRSETRPVPIVPRAARPAAPIASVDQPLGMTASVLAETFTGVPEALVDAVDAADALVESFATVDPEARNGHAQPAITIPLAESAPVRERELALSELHEADAQPPDLDEPSALTIPMPEHELAAAPPSTPDPEPAVSAALEVPSHQPLDTEPVLESQPVVDAEPELKLELESPRFVDTHPEPTLELESQPLVAAEREPEPKFELESRPATEAEPELKLELESRPTVEAEPELKLELESHASTEAEPELKLELESRPAIEAEPELKLELESRAATEAEPELKLELESPPAIEAEAELKLELESPPPLEAEPELKLELESRPTVEAEPELKLELESRPTVEAEPGSKAELGSHAEQLGSMTEAPAAMTAIGAEPRQPVVSAAAPATPPSVFSRRTPEAVARDAKVSFAGMAKDLLPQDHRAPVAEAPVSVPRASVEELTRGAVDQLVGATDKRTTDDRATAFAKPGNAFAKASPQNRPRTIAPPPSDGQPIAGAAKPGSPSKRVEAAGPAATPPAGETAQAMPQGFEGLQFPNDGVLTRQWMEFLNQMAAGK